MEILCLRDPSRGDATSSYVLVNGEFFCHALEDPDREPEGRPEDPEKLAAWVRTWKIPGRTAIPLCKVDVSIERSPRFQKDMITLLRVPGFDGVRVHGGLRPEHTEGCPLLGDEQYETDAGPRIRDGKSAPAVERLFAKVSDALARGERVTWEVRRNPNVMKEAE